MHTIEKSHLFVPTNESKTGLPSKKRSLLLAAIDCVVSFVLVFLVLELLFTIAGVGQEEFLKYDPVMGCSPMPGRKLTYRWEGYSRSSFNSHGMRDRELSKSKAPGVVRVAMLGDSLTEALQVNRNESFPYLFEQKLNTGTEKPKFEVLNFGVGSYYLPQKYLRLKHLALDFNPDLVILEMRTCETLELMPKPLSNMISARPFFLVDANNNLVENHSYQLQWNQSKEAGRMRATSWLREHSSLWGVAGLCMQRLSTKPPAFSSAKIAKKDAAGKDEPVSFKFVPIDPYLKRLTRALILQAKQECQKQNCPMAIVYVTSLRGLRHDEEEAFLEQTAKDLGIPFLNLRKPVEQNVHSSKEPLYLSHFAPRGHKMVADELMSFVKKAYPDLFSDAAKVSDAKEQTKHAL